MNQIFAGISLVCTIVCGASLVELPSTASTLEFMVLGAATGFLSFLTLNLIKD